MNAAPVKQSGASTRRAFLGGSGALAGALAGGAPAWGAVDAETRLQRLFAKLWQEQLHRSPEMATTHGADAGANSALRGKLDDWSRGGRAAWVDWARGAVKRLETFDVAALPQDALVNRSVLIDYYGKIARLGSRWQFGEAASGTYSPVAPYAISQLTGPYRAVPALLGARHAVASSADAEAWLARLSAFAGTLDASTEAFRIDLGAGIVPPVFAIDATLAQLDALRAPAPAAHDLAGALAGKAAAARLAGDWGGKAALMIERVVYPALDRQIAAVRAARERARAEAGVWKLPQGREYYADALAFHTGSALTASEIHKLGLTQVAALTSEMDALLKGLGLTHGTVVERCAELARQPGESFADDDAGRAAVLKEFGAAIGRIRPHLAEMFSTLPAAPVDIRAAPASTVGGAHAINLRDVSAWPRYSIATAAFHEGIPGHLWEAASANADLPAARERGTRYPAYAEGWALYAEQAVADGGFYDSDRASRIGYLQAQLLRAARLVVDTGLHDLGWSHDKAALYMSEVTGRADSAARRDVARFCVSPGQACADKVGQIEWLRLRALARHLAGERYDPRQFNDLIRIGRAPFDVMEQIVTRTFNPKRSVLQARTV